MIRFQPDTWWEALLRPIAMAAPDGHTYAEIMAPDRRFLFAILLAVLLLALRKRQAPVPRGVFVLGGLVALAFVPWLITTGNGRYFLPFLLLAGPLCVALACALPITRTARAICVLGMLTLQGMVVMDNTPWRMWSLAYWDDAPYFDVAVPAELRAQPATFVTITSISYSLVAPHFHPDSRWMNLSAMLADPALSIETRKAHAILAGPGPRHVLVPSMPDHMTAAKLPNPELQDVLDERLAPQRLGLDRTQSCSFLPSRSLARMALGKLDRARPDTVAKLGFWLCPLRYPVGDGAIEEPQAPELPELDPVFAKVEGDCPRFFPPGGAVTRKFQDGAIRSYASADMKLYVMQDGFVYYKYWRALNPERIGSVKEVLTPGFRMDCGNLRGRSGLPWQREI